MAHLILLVQATPLPESRTWSDYNSINECMEGICKIFEEHLKKQNPHSPSITYDVSQLFDFIDHLADLACLVCEKNSSTYTPHYKDWIKEQIYAIECSHVALVSLKMEAVAFEYCRSDRGLYMGINLKNFAQLVKTGGNDNMMTLRFQDDADTYTIIFENTNGDETQRYEMKLIDLDQENLGIPDQDYSVLLKMPSSKFQKICKDMAMFGDSLVVTATENGVQLSAKGDMGTGTVELSQTVNADEPESSVWIDLRKPVNITFAVKNFNHFTKASGLSSQVTLSTSNEIPIVVEYPIEDMGYVRYYLAPKIEDEDN